jgi:hypothetical protein
MERESTERTLDARLRWWEAAVAGTPKREPQLIESLGSSALVDQAKGIVMEREFCTGTEAITLLTAASQLWDIKVEEVAAYVVAELEIRAHLASFLKALMSSDGSAQPWRPRSEGQP